MWRLARILLVIAVTTVGRHSRAGEPDAAALAAEIDRHIEARLKAEQVRPADPADDAEFLRRVYLDLHGVIPTAEQAGQFLADPDPKRRERLIDALLANPRYGEYLADPIRGLDFIEPAGSPTGFGRQVDLLREFETAFHNQYKSGAGEGHRSALDRAVRLMNSDQKRAFDLSREPDAVREAYGKPGPAGGGKPGAAAKVGGGGFGNFGQGCLMARRLVEAGVPFVEVVMGDGVGWDTHRDNFPRTKALSLECDAAMAAVVADLRTRGLLDTTLVVWMGEFGRTPHCAGGGRNHWARAWSTVPVGGGIRGGRVIGKTDRDAAAVVERPIGVTDFLGTACTILGIDYAKKNHPPGVDRPIPVVDTGKGVKVISELL